MEGGRGCAGALFWAAMPNGWELVHGFKGSCKNLGTTVESTRACSFHLLTRARSFQPSHKGAWGMETSKAVHRNTRKQCTCAWSCAGMHPFHCDSQLAIVYLVQGWSLVHTLFIAVVWMRLHSF